MDKKVKVLLSAYNGSKYICEQLDSILNQTYKNIEIIVRDDGSKDNTLEILKPYVENGQIALEKGENVGFVKSFFWLVEHAGDADYYAFSDQDDVWLPNKIEMALERLQEADDSKPVLYFSNYDFYDGNMNFIQHHEAKPAKIFFRNSLVDCVPLGFNMLFNRTAHDTTVANMPQVSSGHDWWMYMLCSGLGQVVYDERVTVKYRRHESNVSGDATSFVAFMIWRFKYYFVSGHLKRVHNQIKEFERLHGQELSTENQKVLRMFAVDGFHPINTLKKAFYPKCLRQKPLDELFVRMVILIGKL